MSKGQVSASVLSRCSHCLWHLVTSQTPPPVSSQVGHDHLYMPGVQHHDHPASEGHKLWHSGQRDSELVNSSHCPPHSGPLCLLWAVHGQSLHGPSHKPPGSSQGHSEGRLVDMTLPLCRNASYTGHAHLRGNIVSMCSRTYAAQMHKCTNECDCGTVQTCNGTCSHMEYCHIWKH